jgi:hypothetical protein
MLGPVTGDHLVIAVIPAPKKAIRNMLVKLGTVRYGTGTVKKKKKKYELYR